MKLTRQAILSKTHYGLDIYCHILRQYYSDPVLLRLVGRDCGLCRNPFSNGATTLHIWIEKSDPECALSHEFARHEDLKNAIPTGDAIGFAAMHYRLKDIDLLKAINRDMHLHIGERWAYNRYVSVETGCDIDSPTLPEISFFKAPISNCQPTKTVNIRDIYFIVKGKAIETTQQLRSISDKKIASAYKRGNFDFVTFSGVFSVRNANSLIKHSGYLCIDFDHLPNAPDVRQKLLHDEYFETQLLFRSPSGDGLKWVIKIDLDKCSHERYFIAVGNYIRKTYGIEIDKSGKDVCRSCFLPHDPGAYINPKLL